MSELEETGDATQSLFDKEGFLRDLHSWNETVATTIAQDVNITLTDAHWEVIHTLRKFYKTHQVSPANRAFVALVKRELGTDKGTSTYLMSLFRNPENNKESAAKLASKIAGLPKPDNCL
jgi:tRNA 2-thiouridine synthesizing protein E